MAEVAEYRSREAAEQHAAVLESGAHLFQLLGLRDAPAPEGADVAMEIDLAPWVANPGGGLQGGLLSALADVTAGRAVFDSLEADQQCVTVDLTMHYLHAVSIGPARAAATVIRRGRQLAVVSVEITDAGRDELAAVSTVTFSITAARP